jgi:hypothetical protein
MGIQFLDPGGEYYFSVGTSTPGIWGDNSGSNVTCINNAPTGRSTQYAIQLLNSHVGKVLGSNFVELIVGVAFYIPNQSFPSGMQIIEFLDTTNVQCDLRVDSTGHLFFTRNGTTLGSASSLALVVNSGWHYIEMQAKIDNTTGTAQVWVDGLSWVSLTGQDTQNTANAFANRVYINQSYGIVNYIKDIYILDTGTGTNTSRTGDVTVSVFYPNAAGVNQQYTNNGGSSQTNSVQDGINHTGTWPDGDTTYISDATIGHISDFAHQALSLTGTFYGVVHVTYMRKDDAGARSAAQVCLSSATTEVGATIVLGNSYNYYYDVLEQNPNTSTAWTPTTFNAATFGVKTIS